MTTSDSPSRFTTHPILLIAAIAVILFCGIGIAAIMGWLPPSVGSSQGQLAPAPGQYGAAHYATGESAIAPATPPAAPMPAHVAATPPATCGNCGVVASVERVKTRAQGSGVGAAGGAVVGGLLGHQFGGGHGRDLATIAGAVGGAVVGNQVEGNMKATHSYTVRVRMADGSMRTVHTDAATWQAGDRVRISKGRLTRR